MDENKENHKCNPCGKYFTLKHNVEKHIKFVHENIKEAKCDSCDKEFVDKFALKSQNCT